MLTSFQIQARFLLNCLLFLSFALKNSAENIREDGNLLPASGFIQAGSGLGPLTLRILSRKQSIERKTQFCQYFTIINPPNVTDSPLIGPNLFELNSQQSVSGHFIWSNGNESVFFVRLDGTRGNWLFGRKIGVDSGYVYLSSSEDTLSPLEILPGKQWRWIHKGKWTEQPEMYLECVADLVQRNQLRSRVLRSLPPNDHNNKNNNNNKEDPSTAAAQTIATLPKYETRYYYKVEFFHPIENLLTAGLIFEDFPIEDFSSLPHLTLPVSEEDYLESSSSSTSEPRYGLFDLEGFEFVSLREVEVVAVFGGLHHIASWSNAYHLIYQHRLPAELRQNKEFLTQFTNGWGSSRAFNRKVPVKEELDPNQNKYNPYFLRLQEYAVLLNVEHTDQAWRVAFRVVNQYLPKRNASSLSRPPHEAISVQSEQRKLPQVPPSDYTRLHPEAQETLPYSSAASLYYDYYYPGKWSTASDPEKIYRVLAFKEYLVELDNEGIVAVDDEPVQEHVLQNRRLLEITPLFPAPPSSSSWGEEEEDDDDKEEEGLEAIAILQRRKRLEEKELEEEEEEYDEDSSSNDNSKEEEEEMRMRMEIAGDGSIIREDTSSSSSSTVNNKNKDHDNNKNNHHTSPRNSNKNRYINHKMRQRISLAQLRDWQLFFRNELLPDLQQGDFLWLWYTTDSSTSSRNEELLVKLLFNHADKDYFFEVYPSHRTEQMQQTALEKTQQLLLLQRRREGGGGLVGRLNGREVEILSMIAIPKPYILRFVLGYLLNKEKVLNKLSTCFFYHAAMTLPQALLYAAEILCVVIGSKPIAMIQYSSPSEHQWKFPLVQELSQTLLMLQTLREEVEQQQQAEISPLSTTDSLIRHSLRINATVFTYEKDETLLFYHQEAATLLFALLPVNKTQALHPLPYELPETASAEERSRVWKEQIFNAAWNGLVLGYPAYFVERYCEEFHNPLTAEDKAKIYGKALRRYHKFLKKIEFSAPTKRFLPIQGGEVQYGFYPPMNKNLLAVLNQMVVQSL